MMYIILLLVLVAAAIFFIDPIAEKVRGWKTVIFSAATGIVGLLEVSDLSDIIPPDQIGYWLLGIGVVGVVLRSITTGPIGR